MLTSPRPPPDSASCFARRVSSIAQARPGWSGADDHDIHLDRFRARWIAANDLIERKGTLVAGRNDSGHVGRLLEWVRVEAAEI